VTIRILLADEQSLLREAVRFILEGQADLQVVAEAADGFAALAEAQRVQPDVAVLAAGLPLRGGIGVTRDLAGTSCRVVLLTATEDVAELVEAVQAGAAGYVARNSPLADLIDAVRVASRGETAIPPRLIGPLIAQLLDHRRAYDEASRQIAALTKREREVLYLLAQGADNEAIGRSLLISPQTARTHIQNILSKLRVHSRLEAAALVRRSGIMQELIPA
jgi:DNA-binding NarL/FixJ family response regulator